jgi:hypothetical protein
MCQYRDILGKFGYRFQIEKVKIVETQNVPFYISCSWKKKYNSLKNCSENIFFECFFLHPFIHFCLLCRETLTRHNLVNHVPNEFDNIL